MSIAFVVVTMINNTIYFFFLKYSALAFAFMTNVLNKIAGLYRKKKISVEKVNMYDFTLYVKMYASFTH